MLRSAFALVLLPVWLGAAAPEPAERRFGVQGFDAVETTAAASLKISRGATFSVVARGDPQAVRAVTVAVRGTTLWIGQVPGAPSRPRPTVVIVLPALRDLVLDGAGDVDVASVEGASFTATVRGSSTLRFARLAAREARVELQGTGAVTVAQAAVERLQLALRGSGSMAAAGSTRILALALGGVGTIDTRALAAAQVTADLAGHGTILTRASDMATVSAAGSGRVEVGGTRNCTVARTGTAQVKCG